MNYCVAPFGVALFLFMYYCSNDAVWFVLTGLDARQVECAPQKGERNCVLFDVTVAKTGKLRPRDIHVYRPDPAATITLFLIAGCRSAHRSTAAAAFVALRPIFACFSEATTLLGHAWYSREDGEDGVWGGILTF